MVESTNFTMNSKKAWATIRRLGADNVSPPVVTTVSAGQIANQLLSNGRRVEHRRPPGEHHKTIVPSNKQPRTELTKPFSLDELATDWAKAWDMQFHPDKCLVMNISKKRHPSKFTYSLHNTDLKTTDTAKYLGIIIGQDMKWTKHITQTCSRANRALGFIKRDVKIQSPRIKEKQYNSLVRPHVEYVSAVWSPREVKPIHQLEMVQRRAARWTLNRHHNTSI